MSSVTSPLTVSIIIPVLQEEARIVDCIERARALSSVEVIVVDGGSSDHTRELASGADQVLSSPRGRATQMNAGAAAASGEVLLFLHADCWLEPAGLEEIRRTLTNRPDVVAGGFRQILDHPGWVYRGLEWGNASRVRWPGWIYGDQGLFVRRSVFEALSGFPNLPLMEDLYLSKQLRRVGKLALLGRHLHVSTRRWEQTGPIRQTLRNWGFILAAHLGTPLDQLARKYRNVR
jgi:rSAM/selenodomain-associated transferase 2